MRGCMKCRAWGGWPASRARLSWSQWQLVPGGPLKAFVNGGYYKVSLYDEDGKATPWAVHRLVAFAHLGPCPDGMIVRHGPKGPLCNSVDNLSYGTYKQNTQDRRRDGTYLFGSSVPTARLTEDQVINIFTVELGCDFRRRDLAEKFNVSEATIKAIRSGRNWRHITSLIGPKSAASSNPTSQRT
jgi:hypothetical protein